MWVGGGGGVHIYGTLEVFNNFSYLTLLRPKNLEVERKILRGYIVGKKRYDTKNMNYRMMDAS